MQNKHSSLEDYYIPSCKEAEAPEAGSQVEGVREVQERAVEPMKLLQPSSVPSWPPSWQSIAE